VKLESPPPKARFKQIALTLLILASCLLSPGCLNREELLVGTPEEVLGISLVLSFFYGATYGTQGEKLTVQTVDGSDVDMVRGNPVQTSMSPTGQGAATSSGSPGSSPGFFPARPARGLLTSAATTIVRTVYQPDAFTKSILIIDGNTLLQTGKITPANTPWDVVLSPDHSTLYAALFPPSGSTAGSIAVISTASQTITRTISLPGAYPQWLAISPDGATLWAADNVGTYTSTGVPTNYVLAIDTATGTVKASLNVQAFNEGAIGRPVASPDGLTVYVPTLPGFQTIDTTTLQTTNLVNASVNAQHSPPPHSVFSPDGRYLYAPSAASVSIVDAGTGKQTGEISLPSSSAVISDLIMINAATLLAADQVSGNLYQINLATGLIGTTIPPPAGSPPNAVIQLLGMQ
jgi:hypothetical protein